MAELLRGRKFPERYAVKKPARVAEADERGRGPNVDWFFWRLVIHETLRANLMEVMYDWTWADCMDAHLVLDYVDGERERARQRR